MSNQSDNLDHASEVEDSFREKAISNIRRQELPPLRFDGSNCVECELPIPATRLALGKFRCISCQSLMERGRKLFKGKYV